MVQLSRSIQVVFNPGDKVQCRHGDRLVCATVIRIAYPFARRVESGVEFRPLPEVSALIRLPDGSEQLVPINELRPL